MPRRILIAEDEPHIRRILRAVLEAEFTVDVATDGYEAFRFLESDTHFDLVVTDLMMPGHSGLELLEHVHVLPHRAGLPVVMLTAKGQDIDRRKAFELGAQDFLTKPFSPKKLLARIQELLAD